MPRRLRSMVRPHCCCNVRQYEAEPLTRLYELRSLQKAVQLGPESAWGLGNECCGQALHRRQVQDAGTRRHRVSVA